MIEFHREAREFERGMSLHYMTLHAIVYGIEAWRTLEFGAGMSTRVFVDAHRAKGFGAHVSVSTETRGEIVTKYFECEDPGDTWQHHTMRSHAFLLTLTSDDHFDVVLHDGSHSRDTVEMDLGAIEPRVRDHGLLLIHDTLHSYSGRGMRAAVHGVFGPSHARVTLPYGFGLTIVEKRAGGSFGYPINVTRTKRSSKHFTESLDV